MLLFERIIMDVRYALRQLRRTPVFTTVAVLTLAVCISLNAAMLSLADAMIFRLPAHVQKWEQLGLVHGITRFSRIRGTYSQYQIINDNSRTLEATAFTLLSSSYGRGPDARNVNAMCVSHTFFPLLGVKPFIGRTFTRAEDVTGADPVAVVSYEFWRDQMGGDTSVLGRDIWVKAKNFTVIGVAPRGFKGTGFDKTDIWVLPSQAPDVCLNNIITDFPVGIIARLRPGVTKAHADAELATLIPPEDEPDYKPPPPRFIPLIKNGILVGERDITERKDVLLSICLACGSLLLLLIGCANVSGLLLSRAVERRREITIRMQVGASRARIVLQLLTETAVLMAFSGLAATALLFPAVAGARAIMPFAEERLFLDMRILGIVVLVLCIATLATGIFPALQMARPQSSGASSQGTQLVSSGSKLRNALVTVQIMLALMLSVGTGLFIRSAQKINDVEMGYEPDGLFDITVNLVRSGLDRAEQNRIYELMLESVQSLDFISSAALYYRGVSTGGEAPYDEYGNSRFSSDFADYGSSLFRPSALVITPDYFSVFKTRILHGRAFTESDAWPDFPAVIVDKRLADIMWPEQNPLGQCLRIAPTAPCSTVVGVSEYQDFNPINSLSGYTYSRYFLPRPPLTQLFSDTLYVRVRDGARADVYGGIRAAIGRAVPGLPFIKIESISAQLEEAARLWVLGAKILSWFGGIAITVAALGVYGVLAFFVRQRTAEIGLRMAVGATPGSILFFILRKGFIPISAGIMLGLITAWWLSRFLRGMILGIEPADPVSFIAAVIIVLLVAGIACLIPAARAAHIDPMHALRRE